MVSPDAIARLNAALDGRYRIEGELGKGGMATVYVAVDLRHDRRVAVKVLRPDIGAAIGRERFLAEIKTTANLHHPHILPLFDSGEAGGLLFYVMPLVDGETLAERLRREGPLPVEEALSVAAEVADALAYAHESGFVHRDVKPSNVLLTGRHALLADFGIARAIDAAGGEGLTETRLVVGTVSYMSPEHAAGETVDGRTDIYSLGCVLYEILVGSPPFTGSSYAVLARHSAAAVPSVRSARPEVPTEVERAITTAMAKTPADRFEDAEALRRALMGGSGTGHPNARGRVLTRPRTVGALAVALIAVLLGVARFSGLFGPDPALDDSRIVVLPLRVSEGYSGPASSGEDVATLIISALDEAGGLRWIDGLARLGQAERDRFRVPGLDEARAMARAVGAAHFVGGSITPTGAGQVQVALTLHETASGELVRTAETDPTPADEAWRGGLAAASQLLSELIEGAPDVEREWRDREPRAVASFLRGEAAFRRVRLGEALARYREAFARDSTFGLAVVRGAQAAAWGHRDGEAAALVERALSLPLPRRYEDFARGYRDYLRGGGDESVAALERTVSATPDMAEAWMQLGEVYTHLLTRAGDPDSTALAAFEEARRLDPAASQILVHLIEIRLRRGESDRAEPLLAQFRAADPDSVFAVKLDLMDRCVRGGPDAVDWTAAATDAPFETLTASKSLGVAGAKTSCAMAGYRAILAVDTSAADVAADGRRWASIIGLQSLLIARGRPLQATEALDAFIDRWGYGTTLLLLDGVVVDTLAPRALSLVREIRDRYGPYRSWSPEYRLWVVGALEATRNDPDEAEAIAEELARRTGGEGAERTALMERSLRAHLALARGDSAEALRRFQELVPATLPGDALSWDEFAPLGLERLALARLLLARGEYVDAIRVADVFDSPSPHIYLLFAQISLRLRLEAARRIPDQLLVKRFEARLAALGSQGTGALTTPAASAHNPDR